MATIKSLDELKAIRDKMKDQILVRDDNTDKIKVLIGMATCGIAAGARATMTAMLDEVRKLGLTNVSIIQSGCMGSCYAEPTVEVRFPGQEGILYGNIDEEKGREIIRKHIKDGELLNNLIIGKPFETV
ncbi:MAG: (2Fe-2S) ferredoxin domain-containing protein [Bacillota bacterium]|nr:(2Fe-2S) ferredoxin domain-containing protein [Bacillota bacterium]